MSVSTVEIDEAIEVLKRAQVIVSTDVTITDEGETIHIEFLSRKVAVDADADGFWQGARED